VALVVDRDLLLRKVASLETYLGQLATFRDVHLDRYRHDWQTQRIVERTLHLAIETCMDIADHIVSDRRLRVPETGAETFEILAQAGVLTTDLGASLFRMVGFRNILVHDYARLDQALVLRALREDWRDMEAFRDEVVRTL
jgi:uncharacterized protein YutE (UPF0331/DUF86 family)